MKRIAAYLILINLGSASLWAMPSQITFQGTLKQKGIPVNTTKNMQFSFVDGSGSTIPGTTPVTVANVQVTNGLFAVQLPIDPSIPWEQYSPFVRVSVEGQILNPDQPLNANLYAVAATPPGVIVAFGGQTPPPGWFLCDGTSKNRLAYSALFQAIGTTWGAVDGSNFNVPDLRGRAPIGTGQGAGLTNRTLGDMLGEETHTLTIAEMPSHDHGITDPGHTHPMPTGVVASGGGSVTAFLGSGGTQTGSAVTNISIKKTGGDAPHNIMPPSAVINFIIKY